MYYQKQSRGRWNSQGGGKSGSSQKTGFKRPSKLDFGMKGFLCTTNFNEKNAVKEAYNLLNEYHDDNDELTESSGQLNLSKSKMEESGTGQSFMKGGSGGSEEGKDDSRGSVSLDEPNDGIAGDNKKISEQSDDDDVESAIAEEISRLKSSEVKYKFQSVDTGVPNLIFINTTIGDPVKLTNRILQDLLEKKQQKCRFLLRMIPIEITCRADVEEIKKAAELILPKYFKTGFNSFQVAYKSRYNNSMDRGESK
ncbi:unnamed protein product [Allacma fusca]|uniref:THUMP domain-containing protein n=1 Tax=Allacma fusca TaxID=39272 RepID=A0A8J2J4T3_9HEXA|nr:unnamed protein product [Allacma fusca]